MIKVKKPIQLDGSRLWAALSWTGAVDVLEAAYKHLAVGKAGNMPKQTIVSPNIGWFMSMGAYDWPYAGQKFLTVWNKTRQDYPLTQGTFTLVSVDTGQVLAVLDASALTHIRTACCGALAARYFVQTEPKILGVVGYGMQGRSHISAMMALFPSIERLNVFDESPYALKELAEWGIHRTLEVRVTECARWAVDMADIVIIATTSEVPVIHWNQGLQNGSFVDAVYGFHDVDIGMISRPEIQWFMGYTPEDSASVLHYDGPRAQDKRFRFLAGDLVDVIVQRATPTLEDPDRIILFTHLGMGLDDLAIGSYLYDQITK